MELNYNFCERENNSPKCYLKIGLFVSRKNNLLQKYALVIPSKDPDNIRNVLKIDW
jgi:hypothetical protein